MDDAILDGILLNPLVWGFLLVYFFPTVIAVGRRSGAAAGVFGVNLLFGWSGIGMLVAYALAFGTPTNGQLEYRRTVQRAKDEFYLREAEKANTPAAE